jgi:hypothetical protein
MEAGEIKVSRVQWTYTTPRVHQGTGTRRSFANG